ncbi:MAG: hypothetical protein KGJ07_03590 [Patescibacteria group bacterium]|nr:hypothetical protein [Patescibacteria group bacterium]
MKTHNLLQFTRGWFIGNFDPSLAKTEGFEVGIKQYKKGDVEEPHFHKVAQEYTVIISGLFRINGKIYKKDSIINFEPNDISHFECIKDGSTVVIKIPSVKGDKYVVKE